MLAVICGSATAQSDNPFDPQYKPRDAGIDGLERNQADWREGEFKLPAYPKPENLIEFEVSKASSFQFFVDGESISVGPDRVVRYTLVARSRSGVESVSYNGLRCSDGGKRKTYATGIPSKGAWVASLASEWREVERRSVNRQYLALARDFFCPAGIPIASRGEGVDALKRGGHPDAVSIHSDFRN